MQKNYRRLVLLANIVLVTACANDSTAPTSTLAGTYHLTTINGQPLPFIFPPDSSLQNGDTLIHYVSTTGETITLLPGGRFRDSVTGVQGWKNVPAPSDSTTGPWPNYYAGRWEVDGTRVAMIIDSSSHGGGPVAPVVPDGSTFYLDLGEKAGDLTWTLSYDRGSLGGTPQRVTFLHLYHKE